MKRIFVYLSIFLSISLSAFSQEEILNNATIIEMKNFGFSDEVIVSKIKTSKSDFDTSLDGLKDLKAKGISDSIITAVIHSNKNVNEIADNLKTGIYLNEGNQYKRIIPTVFSGAKTNTLGMLLSLGVASAKIISVLNNPQSTNIITDSNPKFTFRFAAQKGDDFTVDPSNWWFFSASSPNQFVLVRLESKKNKRELVTGKENAYSGTNMGVDDKYIIPYTVEIISDYEYIVTPQTLLPDGEYCFFYQGSVPQGVINQSVFDFSVQSHK